MRLRGTTRELQSALEDESGARDRAALLLAIASAVNSSLALEEVLNVALTHAGRIMGAVAGAMYLVQPGKTDMKREGEYNLAHRARGSIRKIEEEPVRTAIAAMRPLVVKLDEKTAPGIEGGGHPQCAAVSGAGGERAHGRADQAAEPARAGAAVPAGDAAGAAPSQGDRFHDDRPRPLQAGQRHIRPPERRCRAARAGTDPRARRARV